MFRLSMNSFLVRAAISTGLLAAAPAVASCPLETHVQQTFLKAPSGENREVIMKAMSRILGTQERGVAVFWEDHMKKLCKLRPEEQRKWIELIQFDSHVAAALEGTESEFPPGIKGYLEPGTRFLRTSPELLFKPRQERLKDSRRYAAIMEQLQTIAPLAVLKPAKEGTGELLALTCARKSPNSPCEAYQYYWVQVGLYGVDDYAGPLGPELTPTDLTQLNKQIYESLRSVSGGFDFVEAAAFTAIWSLSEAGPIGIPVAIAIQIAILPYEGVKQGILFLAGRRQGRDLKKKFFSSNVKSHVILPFSAFTDVESNIRSYHY